MACGILVPQPGIETTPLAVEAWSLNHWTIREVPRIFTFKQWIQFSKCTHPTLHPECLSLYVIVSWIVHFVEWKFCQILIPILICVTHGCVSVCGRVRSWGLWRWWGKKMGVDKRGIQSARPWEGGEAWGTCSFQADKPTVHLISRCLCLVHPIQGLQREGFPSSAPPCFWVSWYEYKSVH